MESRSPILAYTTTPPRVPQSMFISPRHPHRAPGYQAVHEQLSSLSVGLQVVVRVRNAPAAAHGGVAERLLRVLLLGPAGRLKRVRTWADAGSLTGRALGLRS